MPDEIAHRDCIKVDHPPGSAFAAHPRRLRLQLVYAVQGLDTFGIDQLALENNRPGLILQRMGFGISELIDHYEAQWRRRFKKAGLTEADMMSEVDLPTAHILRARQLGSTPGVAELIFGFRDSVELKNYQVYVDNVPIFEGYGKPGGDKPRRAASHRERRQVLRSDRRRRSNDAWHRYSDR